jgi:mRNA interferase RelE/StbE
MQVKLTKSAAKYFKGINEPLKGRIRKALAGLALNPPQGDIKKLANRDHYRLRVGEYRILFLRADDNIVVDRIAPRGEAYKD